MWEPLQLYQIADKTTNSPSHWRLTSPAPASKIARRLLFSAPQFRWWRLSLGRLEARYSRLPALGTQHDSGLRGSMASRAVYTTVNQERTWIEMLIKFTTQERYDLIIHSLNLNFQLGNQWLRKIARASQRSMAEDESAKPFKDSIRYPMRRNIKLNGSSSRFYWSFTFQNVAENFFSLRSNSSSIRRSELIETK